MRPVLQSSGSEFRPMVDGDGARALGARRQHPVERGRDRLSDRLMPTSSNGLWRLQ
jgi:hypothetical protein